MATDPFLAHAQAQFKAEQIVPNMSGGAKDSLLLWAVYRKRIKRPEGPVAWAAGVAFLDSAEASGVMFDSDEEARQVMDAVSDILWNQLDDQTRYAWLLKAV